MYLSINYIIIKMRKIFTTLHLWLSVPFGIIITIVCFTGATLIFESEVNEIVNHERYFVKQIKDKSIPLDRLAFSVQSSLPDSVSITSVVVSSNPERTVQFNLSKPRKAALFVDQYTGEILSKNDRLPFFTFMFRLHRWLLDSVKPGNGISWGKLIVGFSTLVFVLILITGLFIWIPRSIRGLRNRLKIVTNKNAYRFWFDLHVAGGFYATALLLIMALTGLTWSFPWYRTAFYKVFGVEMIQNSSLHAPSQKLLVNNNNPNKENTVEHAKRKGKQNESKTITLVDLNGNETFMHWQVAMDEVVALNRNYKYVTVSDGIVAISFNKWGNQRASDKYIFNNTTGKIDDVELYSNQPKSSKIRGWIYSVHVGDFGGMLTKIIYLIAAIMGAILPITGYYLWIKRLRKQKKRKFVRQSF